VRGLRQDAGVVDDDVDVAELLLDEPRCDLHRCLVGDVHRDAGDRVTLPVKPLRGLLTSSSIT
jgi:hypothetical protein